MNGFKLYGQSKIDVIIIEYCTNYRNISEPWRKLKDHDVGENNLHCDETNVSFDGSTWFRFIGAAGTRLQTAPNALSMQRKLPCKTHGVSWINGSHPLVSEGVVSRQICYAYNGVQCWGSTLTHDMNIAACAQNDGNIFYVYQLTNPKSCEHAYCAE